ncbi:hypothetical protein H4Q26_014103 [Puccinia striiformis f. sp. tritici PST-130]|nr:hypothetical protein H4Q26_014103 [Puccinia striiformis f. sp. tritici PST-130]
MQLSAAGLKFSAPNTLNYPLGTITFHKNSWLPPQDNGDSTHQLLCCLWSAIQLAQSFEFQQFIKNYQDRIIKTKLEILVACIAAKNLTVLDVFCCEMSHPSRRVGGVLSQRYPPVSPSDTDSSPIGTERDPTPDPLLPMDPELLPSDLPHSPVRPSIPEGNASVTRHQPDFPERTASTTQLLIERIHAIFDSWERAADSRTRNQSANTPSTPSASTQVQPPIAGSSEPASSAGLPPLAPNPVLRPKRHNPIIDLGGFSHG